MLSCDLKSFLYCLFFICVYFSEFIYISKCDIDVINHAKKSLLFDGSHT